tara:strand:+ start:748 stop:2055 length:1308 start_codon:yes stop_codon:yes gene_type:complete
MIEILNIIFTLIVFSILSFFSSIFLVNFSSNKKKIDILDISGSSFIIFLNIILIFSLINPNKELLFYFCILISVLSIFILIKNSFNLDNKMLYSFLLLFVLLVSIDISNNFEYTWDTKKYYLHKTTAFYQNFFINDFVKKIEYPHFGSYVWAFFWKNNLINSEYTGRLIYGYIYVLSIFYFINSFNCEKYLKILVSIFLILITYKTILFDGRPDILMFAYFLFISKHLNEIFHKNKFTLLNIFFVILLLNLIIWTKSEGIAYVILIGSTLLIFAKGALNKKMIFLSLIFAVIFIKYFTYHYYGISLNPHHDTFNTEVMNKIDLNFIFIRSFEITSWYIIYLFTNPIIIFSFMSLLIIFYKYKKLLVKFNYLYFFLIAKFFVLFVTFFVTAYPMPFHVKYSLDRIIFHSSGLFLVIIYYCVIHILNDKKKLSINLD